MTNLYDNFDAVASRCADRPAIELLARAGLVTRSYADVRATAGRVAELLRSHGRQPGERCAILGDNDDRWCAAYFGILRLGAVAVPLDTAYKAKQVQTVVSDCGAAVLFVSAKYLAVARDAVRPLTAPPLLVLFSGDAPGCVSIDHAPAVGGARESSRSPASASDPAVILYTSGTTSDPKGVVLTHGNLLAEIAAALKVVPLNERDSILAILPLFHALAQLANLLLPLTLGMRVVFLETLNSSEMMRGLHERHVTAFCVVPQFYYLLHQRVLDQVKRKPWLVRRLFSVLLSGNRWLRATLHINLGRLVFRSVHDALGGRMRIMVTGGSRFDPGVGRDLYGMGLNIIQAYGLTECSGAGTTTRPGDPHVDTVGLPLDGVEIRIMEDPADAAEREHRDGEVLIKGPIVMAGYYNRPDANAVTLRDGWLHTGDLGFIDASGRLHITGRKKEMIVLASGKNIYPEEIESVYLQSPYIKELCVLGVALPGEPSAERLHAIIVPDLDVMRERRIVNMREIIRFDIESLSIQLPHHKRVLSFDMWREELPRTTTRKLKRHAIEQLYRDRQTEAADPKEAAEWRDEDQVWAAEPFVSAALAAIRAAAKPGSAVTPDANLELDLGLDSMERVELLTKLEQLFATDVPDEDANRIYSVRELVEAVRPTTDAGGQATRTGEDPWERILAEPIDDPAISAILAPKRLSTPIFYAIVRVARVAARALMGLRILGRERLPEHGPYIICPNHQSYVDAFLLVGALPYRQFKQLFFVGASEYFDTPVTAKLAALMNVIPVDPDANLVRAMQAGGFGLRNNRILVLFPEGERSPDGTPRKFKKGAAILSHQLKAAIVPVAMDGMHLVWPRGSGLKWKALTPWAGTRSVIEIGAPLSPEATDESGGDRYAAATARLRHRIVSMFEALRR